MSTKTQAFVLVMLALGGCAVQGGEEPIEADAPLLGAADSTDRADRRCTVVMREASPRIDASGQPVEVCDASGCYIVWSATVDVARGQESGDLAILARLASAPGTPWFASHDATYVGGDDRFARFEVTFGQHLASSWSGLEGVEIELIPYLDSGYGRVFDKNRVAGDFDNYWLTEDNDFRVDDNGACAGAGAEATLTFPESGRESVSGELRANGQVHFDYAVDRLAVCRGTHNGYRGWDITAHVLFHPGEQYQHASVVSSPASFYIPANAESMEVWFLNTSIDCRGEGAYDSNYGANYRFDIAR